MLKLVLTMPTFTCRSLADAFEHVAFVGNEVAVFLALLLRLPPVDILPHTELYRSFLVLV